MIYADRRETTPLSITRARPQPSVEIVGVATVAAKTFLCCNWPVLRMTLHETAGETLQVEPPALLSLTRKGKNQEKLQASYSTASFTDSEGTAVKDPIPLSPGGNENLKLHLNWLRGAGEYNGTLRVAVADSQPIDQPFTILLKEWWPTPFIIIAAGVGLSFLLRFWLKQVEPQLTRQIRLEALDEQLETESTAPPGLDDVELAVVRALRDRLAALYQQLSDGPVPNADATLDDIEQKAGAFPNWVNARRRVAAIKAAEARRDLETRLRTIGDYLGNPAHDEPAFTNHTNFLANITAEIDAAVQTDLLRRLTELRTDMDERRPGLKPSNQLRLDEEIVPLRVAAEAQAAASHLDEVRRLYDRARGLHRPARRRSARRARPRTATAGLLFGRLARPLRRDPNPRRARQRHGPVRPRCRDCRLPSRVLPAAQVPR